MQRNNSASVCAMQSLMQRWEHGRGFTLLVKLALLVALLSLFGGESGAPREALADGALAEVVAEAGELSGDGADSDAEALVLTGAGDTAASSRSSLAPRRGMSPPPRRPWHTPAARAPPTSV